MKELWLEMCNWKINPEKIKLENVIAFALVSGLIAVFANYGIAYYDPIREMESDQVFYRLFYEGEISVGYFEPGYVLLNKLFNFMDLNYVQFKMVLALLSCILIFQRIRGHSINYLFLTVLYIITMYFFDLEQSRNFLAMSIVVYATKFFPLNRRKDSFKYSIYILLASSIHLSMLFYLSVFLLKNKKIYRARKVIYVFIIMFCILANRVPSLLTGIGKILSMLLHSERIGLWFSYRTNGGFFLCLGLYLALFFWVGYLKKKVIYKAKMYKKEDVKLIMDAHLMLEVLMLTVPLYLLSTEFFRLVRGIFVLEFAAILLGIQLQCQQLRLKSANIKMFFQKIGLYMYAITFMCSFPVYVFIVPAILKVFC